MYSWEYWQTELTVFVILGDSSLFQQMLGIYWHKLSDSTYFHATVQTGVLILVQMYQMIVWLEVWGQNTLVLGFEWSFS